MGVALLSYFSSKFYRQMVVLHSRSIFGVFFDHIFLKMVVVASQSHFPRTFRSFFCQGLQWWHCSCILQYFSIFLVGSRSLFILYQLLGFLGNLSRRILYQLSSFLGNRSRCIFWYSSIIFLKESYPLHLSCIFIVSSVHIF